MSDRANILITSAMIAAVLALAPGALAQEAGTRLTADQALQLALEKNPSLRSTVLDEEQARVAVQAEEGLYPLMLQLDGGFTHSSSPTVDTNGDVTHRSTNTTSLGAELSKTLPIGTETSLRVEGNRQDSESRTGTGDSTNYGVAARLQVTQPLLRGAGKAVVQSSLRQAVRSEAQAALQTRVQASETALNVMNAYWSLWYAEQAVEIELNARDLAKAQLDEITARVEAGDTAPVEALSYQTRVAELEESVVQAQANRESKAVTLASLLGFSTADTNLYTTGEAPAVDASSSATREAVAEALQRSPEVRTRLAAIALAEERSKTAGESMRQRLDLTAWLEANTLGNDEVSPAFQQFGEGEAYSAYIGFVYELPLDDTRKRAQRASARLDVDIANQQLLVTRDSVKAQVLNLLREIESAKVRVRLSASTLAIAERQAEAERQRLELGDATFIEVREAEEAVREAELRTAQAQVDLLQSQLELDHLTGRLLDRYESLIPKKGA